MGLVHMAAMTWQVMYGNGVLVGTIGMPIKKYLLEDGWILKVYRILTKTILTKGLIVVDASDGVGMILGVHLVSEHSIIIQETVNRMLDSELPDRV